MPHESMTLERIAELEAECAECLSDRVEFCEGSETVKCEHCSDKLALITEIKRLQQRLAERALAAPTDGQKEGT